MKAWDEDGAGSVRFTHWLVRMVGYEAMLAPHRRSLHRTVAQSIEAGSPAKDGSPGPALLSDSTVLHCLVYGEPLPPHWTASAGTLADHWRAAGEPGRSALCRLVRARSGRHDGSFREALAACNAALECAPGPNPSLLRTVALLARGQAQEKLARYGDALASCEQVAARLPATGADGAGVLHAQATLLRGLCRMRAGNLDAARDDIESALSAARVERSRRDEVRCVSALGNLLAERGEFRAARGYVDEALAGFREIGDRRGEAIGLTNLGSLHWTFGERGPAIERLTEALRIEEEIGDRGGAASSLSNLGAALWSRGDYPGAERLLLDSLAIRVEAGELRGITASLHNLANVEQSRGDDDAAIDRFSRCVALRREMGNPILIASSLWNLGAVLARRGRTAEALEALDESVGIGESVGLAWLRSEALAARAVCRWLAGDAGGSRTDAVSARDLARGLEGTETGVLALVSLARCAPSAEAVHEAVDRARAYGNPLYVAESLLAASEHARSGGAAAAAVEAAREAASIARSIGAGEIVRRMEARGIVGDVREDPRSAGSACANRRDVA